MIESKWIGKITAILLAAACLFTGALVCFPNVQEVSAAAQNPALTYAEKVFGGDGLLTIDIRVDEDAWQSMLENALDEEYISCDVSVNGTVFSTVGIRPKGNSSLTQIANDNTTDRYSFKLEFDHYINGQTCFGLDKFVLNNVQSDATYMKEYLSYKLMEFIGVKSPLCTYANITVNGEPWGFYIAVESIEESFAERVYGSDYGMLYKPESTEMGGAAGRNREGNDDQGAPQLPEDGGLPNGFPNKADKGNLFADSPGMQGGEQQGMAPPENAQGGMIPQSPDSEAGLNNDGAGAAPPDLPGAENGESGGGNTGNAPAGDGHNDASPGKSGGNGADLVYTDDDPNSYSAIFDNAVFDTTEQDYARVIEALKKLNSGEELEQTVDVDQVLRYFAANTVLVSLDGYAGTMLHNYYLYEKDGQISILPWDYNLSFAGFQSGDASAAVNFPIDTPVSGTSLEERPLIGKLLEVEEYRERYHAYLQQIVTEFFQSGLYERLIDTIDTMIAPYVQEDPSAFYTYEQYKSSLPVLKAFGLLRAESIAGQLSGAIPSTSEGQSKDPSSLVDASSITLSALGSQGGGNPGRGGQNDTQSKTEDESPSQDTDPNDIPAQGGMQDTLSREVMQQAGEILRQAQGALTQEQQEQLLALGISEEQLEMLQGIAGEGRGSGFTPGALGNAFSSTEANRGTNSSLILLIISFAAILIGTVLAAQFHRKRYQSPRPPRRG
jgi:spore coat protein CotH